MARLGTAVLLLACAATVSALPPLLGGPPPHLGNPACVAMAGRLQTGACHPVSETLRPQAGQLATATCATVKDMAATAQARPTPACCADVTDFISAGCACDPGVLGLLRTANVAESALTNGVKLAQASACGAGAAMANPCEGAKLC